MYYLLIACTPVTRQNYCILDLHCGFCCSSGWTNSPHFFSSATWCWDSEDATGCWGRCEPPGEGEPIYILDNAVYVYHSLSSVSTKHFLEKFSVTNFECLSHKVSSKQFHKLLIQSCPLPWHVESFRLSRPQVGVLCFMEQRKVTLRWRNSWSREEQTSASRTRYRVCVVQ